jgi:hypothetical protein
MEKNDSARPSPTRDAVRVEPSSKTNSDRLLHPLPVAVQSPLLNQIRGAPVASSFPDLDRPNTLPAQILMLDAHTARSSICPGAA